LREAAERGEVELLQAAKALLLAHAAPEGDSEAAPPEPAPRSKMTS
jgi:hypothetical protein